jgi:sugar/nucleoside kinase (ribokinase family)
MAVSVIMTNTASAFDLAFVGHYTQDTVVRPQETYTTQGGAFYYGCHVARRMGLQAAVVTRLARADFAVVDELAALGVTMFATPTPESTCLRLVYPTDNLDQRTIYATGFAGPFTVAEVAPIQARTFHIGASIRGEVPLAVVQALAAKGARLSLDAQGFVRVNLGGTLVYEPWPEAGQVLSLVDVLKVDAVEAEFLTGHSDLREAAQALAALGPREVVMTHGQGVLVLADGRFYQEPFVAQEVRGRTGRGDTCIAAYLGRRLTATPGEAAVWAAALTSLKLETPGPFRRDIGEVEALVRSRYR